MTSFYFLTTKRSDRGGHSSDIKDKSGAGPLIKDHKIKDVEELEIDVDIKDLFS